MKKTKKDKSQEYFHKIEKKFNQLRGSPILISPKDWSLMVQWQKEGIPPVVIMEALEKGFERAAIQGSSKRGINSLSYFKGIVKEHWKSFQKLRVGKIDHKPSELELQKVKEYLKDLAYRLSELSQKFLSHSLLSQQLKKGSMNIKAILKKNLKSEDDLEIIEEHLSAIDEAIGESLLTSIEKEMISETRREAEKELSSIGHYMKEDHYKDIKQRYILKKLRKRYGIPRVSLFFQ